MIAKKQAKRKAKTGQASAPVEPTYPIHPVCHDYADFTEAEAEAMRESLRELGLLNPIVLWHEQIVDGRHREMFCRELGIEARYADLTDRCPTEKEMRAYVAALNQHRRSRTTPLTVAEKREKVDAALKADPERSDRAIAEACGVSDMFVAKRRKKLSKGGANVCTHPTKRKSRSGKRGEGQRKPKPKPKPKPDEDNSRIWAAAKRALRAGKHVWKFDDGYGDGEKWYAILPAPSHDADGRSPYLFDEHGKFGPYDTAEEAEAVYAECKNGWGYEDEPEPQPQPQPQPKTDELVRQAEERARQAESNFADMQARFFQANAEATALKAQMTAEPAAPQPYLKPAPDDPVQGLADDIVLLVRGHNELTYRQVLTALDLARSLINIEQEVFDPDDEPAPTQPAEELIQAKVAAEERPADESPNEPEETEEDETDDDEPEEETPRRRRAKKPAPRTVPIEKALGEVFDTFQELAEEMQNWADGMPESLQNSYKHEEVTEAADTLQGIYQPTVNGTVAGLQIEIQDPTPTRKNDTRHARCAQAIYIIDTVVTKLKEVGGEEAAGLRNELTNAKDEAEEVVFPGMY